MLSKIGSCLHLPLESGDTTSMIDLKGVVLLVKLGMIY